MSSSIPAWRRFIVQYDFSHNAIPLAFFAFTLMLQTITTRLDIINLPQVLPTLFFIFSLIILVISSLITLLRIIIFPPAVFADFFHSRLTNFFFLPAIIGPIALLAAPSSIRSFTAYRLGFYVIGTYQVLLSLYHNGEWLFAAAPTRSIYPLVFMQTIGFFLLSILASISHLPDHAFFMLSVGLLFWLLVFFTNFQHVSLVLGKQIERPQPAFFLFIAPPAQAAIAFVFLDAAEASPATGLLDVSGQLPWSRPAEAMLYIDLFLYLLVFRLIPTWWREDFKVAWWAYVFPLSGAASAAILRYQSEDTLFWAIIAITMSVIAVLAMVGVFGLSVWAFWTGRAPVNNTCLASYVAYYATRYPAQSDLEAGGVQ